MGPKAAAGTILAAWLAASSAVHAAPIASGQVVRDFTRITFEWAQPTTLQTRMEGNKLVITFDRRASDPDFSRLLTHLPKVVRSASLGADGRTITLSLDKSYRTRSFVSGRLTGVDLLGTEEAANSAPPKETKPAKAEKTTPVAEKKAPAKPAAKKPAEPVAESAPPAPPKILLAVTPRPRPTIAAPATASQAEAAPVPQVEVKDTQTAQPPITPTAPAPQAEASAPAQAPEAPPVQQPPVVALPVVQEKDPSVAAATNPPEALAVPERQSPNLVATAPAATMAPQKIQLQRVNAVPLAVQAQANGDEVLLRFPWTERTAAAAFARGNDLWLIFDRPAALNVDAVKNAPLLRSVEQLSQPNATVLRLSGLGLKSIRLQRAAEGQGWDAVLTPRAAGPLEPLLVQPKTDTPLKPYLLVNALETAPPLDVTDPVVGDTLRVVPSYTPGQGVAPARDYVEMELLASSQGIVIASHGPDIGVVTQRNGLRLSATEGLRLSPGLPSVPAGSDKPAETARPSLFAVNDMEPETGETIRSMEAEFAPLLLRGGALAEAARLRLAQAYLSQGLAAEALGMLGTLRDANIEAFIRERASAYSGLANFLMGRLSEAARDFGTPELQGNEEMDIWRGILAELTGQTDDLFDYPRFQARYLSQYPEVVRRRLGIVAIDRLILKNRYNEALAIINDMKKAKLDKDPATDHALSYFGGEVLARTGYPDKADVLWKGLTENLDDRYWRARAEYARINLGLAQNKLTEAQAIPRLDALRILWRDDPLEQQVLKQLGALQIKQKQYRDGLRTLKEITTAYPNTEDAFKAAQVMAATFLMLFNEDGAKEMKPLEALTLYYEFKELTPVEAAGDQMIRNLADRLAEVDLLDRAAALLDHQVKFRLTGEERSRVGARLALIKLLDRKPQEALDVLEMTGYGANPADLQQKRDLLTARALADLKEGDRAVKLLEDDASLDANLLKLDIFWDKGDWKNVAVNAETILSQRADPTKPLTDAEMSALLKLALAYSFERDMDQLHYLRDYFTPLVKDHPNKDLFAFLTSDTPVTPQGLAQMAQNIAQMQSFLGRYRTQMKAEGLSEAVK